MAYPVQPHEVPQQNHTHMDSMVTIHRNCTVKNRRKTVSYGFRYPYNLRSNTELRVQVPISLARGSIADQSPPTYREAPNLATPTVPLEYMMVLQIHLAVVLRNPMNLFLATCRRTVAVFF